MINRSAIMKSAWRIYRSRRPVGSFLLVCWREALRNAWGMWRLDRDAPCSAPVMSPMAAAIDATKYLLAHMSQADAIAQTHSHFAASA